MIRLGLYVMQSGKTHRMVKFDILQVETILKLGSSPFQICFYFFYRLSVTKVIVI